MSVHADDSLAPSPVGSDEENGEVGREFCELDAVSVLLWVYLVSKLVTVVGIVPRRPSKCEGLIVPQFVPSTSAAARWPRAVLLSQFVSWASLS